MLLLLLHLVLSVKANEVYFVVPSNGASCPTNANCRSLSYFTEHPSLYFSDNTVFYFLEGRHVLVDTVEINGVNNLTLKGLGTMEQGFHYTVLQSTVEITCEGAVSAGLVFVNVSEVSISNLMITRCSGPPLREVNKEFNDHLSAIQSRVSEAENQSSSVLILQSSYFVLSNVSITNTTGYGLTAINLFNSTISNSSFAANNLKYQRVISSTSNSNSESGNVFIAYTYPWPDVCAPTLRDGTFLVIEYSNFSFGHFGKPSYPSLGGGGGLMVLLDQGNRYQSSISVIGVTAFKNVARASGNIQFFVTQRTTSFEFICYSLKSLYGNVNFNNSYRRRTRGGGILIHLGFRSSLVPLNCSLFVPNKRGVVLLQNSVFSHNFAEFGGGALIRNLIISVNVVVILRSCNFTYNEGWRGVGLSIIQSSHRTSPYWYIINVTVSESVYRGYSSVVQDLSSSVSFYFMRIIRVYNLKVLSNNRCYGVYMYYSVIIFYGQNNTFFNNTSLRNGGAIYVSTLSHIEVAQNTFITFTNNHASRLGGALFVDTNQLFVPFCFLGVFEYSNTLGMIFINNSAKIQGDAVYIDSCSRLQRDQHMYGQEIFKVLNLDGQPMSVTNAFSSAPYRILHCSYNRTVKHIVAYPGEYVIMPIITRGIFDVRSPGLIQVTRIRNSKIRVILTDITPFTNLSSPCMKLAYLIRATKETTNVLLLVHAQQRQTTENGVSIINNVEFNTSVLRCPGGFMLYQDVCQCDQLLLRIVPSITCRITTRLITRAGIQWIGFDNNSHSTLVTTNCPYDYCVDGSVSFNESTPNNQCRMNRSGILCGQCSEGLSLMLGSNQCGVCNNSTLYLLVVFGVAGIALVLLLVVLNLTVSVGTINGIIFYTNVIKINQHAFLSSSSPPVICQFISWFNLDLGISTCFSSNLDTLTKLALQFMFPAYIWILIGVIIIMCKYSQRLSKLIGHNAVPVFATLILLSYTKVLRTLVPILMFNRLSVLLQNSSLSTQLYWSADGNVLPSSPYYIALASLGVFIVTFFTIPYTILLIFQPLILSKCGRPYFQKFCLSFKPVFDAYYGPYQVRFRFWTGILLCVRTALVVVAVFTTDESYLSISTTFGIILLCTMGYLNGVYEQKLANTLEYWCLLNITLLSAVVKTVPYAAVIDLSVMFCTFVVVILYHCYTIYKFISNKLQGYNPVAMTETIDSYSITVSHKGSNSTDVREPLLFSGELP